jgi:hypothetical protein
MKFFIDFTKLIGKSKEQYKIIRIITQICFLLLSKTFQNKQLNGTKFGFLYFYLSSNSQALHIKCLFVCLRDRIGIDKEKYA